jgi:hypothetical protein
MHDSPEAITRALSRVIRERWSADKAFAELQEAAPEGSGEPRGGAPVDREEPA